WGGPAGNGEREWLRRHVADESTPVGERGTRRVRDVLVGQPDRAIGIGYRCRVVAPARSACPDKGDVAGEAVLRSGARARDMDAARATGAHRGIGCAREDVRPSYGEAEERLPTGVDTDGREQHTLLVHRNIALTGDAATCLPTGGGRRDDEIGDAHTRGAVRRLDNCVHAGPELASGIDHLIHAVVIAGEELQLLFWDAQSVSERARAVLLLRIGRLPVDLAVEDRMRQAHRWRRAERGGIGGCPNSDAVVERRAEVECAQEILGAIVGTRIAATSRNGRGLDAVPDA